MTRVAVVCLCTLVPIASARADDPKPDVAGLKDEVELLEAKLAVHKAKVAGAAETAKATRDLVEKFGLAERAGAVVMTEVIKLKLAETQATTELEVFKAELKVAEVMLNQAKRRLALKAGGAKEEDNTYSVRFENAKWTEVVDWLRKETGLVYAGTAIPKGSVTIKPIGKKRHTLAEVVDLLNDALEKEQYQIIRRQQTFSLWPMDRKIESQDVARISRTDLAARGNSEVVQLVVEFDSRFEDTLLPFVRRMLRPDGKAIPVGSEKDRKEGIAKVILQDRSGSLLRALAAFDLVPAPVKQNARAIPAPGAK